eukprot:TRINITY_DN6676_c0_g1_i2.p1 TRINITY_DN6676_c0_g1~~TRINITY_DN6676_c0_g1_i2.p1  ORF type:complete len:192 (+),score=32.42 TRINITY_DN6676_c0_g1_i2:50-625(+)
MQRIDENKIKIAPVVVIGCDDQSHAGNRSALSLNSQALKRTTCPIEVDVKGSLYKDEDTSSPLEIISFSEGDDLKVSVVVINGDMRDWKNMVGSRLLDLFVRQKVQQVIVCSAMHLGSKQNTLQCFEMGNVSSQLDVASVPKILGDQLISEDWASIFVHLLRLVNIPTLVLAAETERISNVHHPLDGSMKV